MGILRSIAHALDAFLAPPLCPACREERAASSHPDSPLCSRCAQTLHPLPEESCPLCGAPLNTALELCQDCASCIRPWIAGTCA